LYRGRGLDVPRMARDARIRLRNLLVLPGGLLTLYAVIGLAIVALRAPAPPCNAGYRFLVGGACYSAYPFLGILLILGVALVVVGLLMFRGKPDELTGHLHAGTPTHFALAVLASLVVVPVLAWLVLAYVEASQGLHPFTTVVHGSRFQTKFLFELAAVAGVLMLLPFLGLYLAQANLRRRFLREVEAVADEESAPAPFPGEAHAADPAAPPPEEFVDEAQWPAGRPNEASPTVATASAPPMPTAVVLPPPSTQAPVAASPASPFHAALADVPQAPSRREPPKPAAAPMVAVAPGCRAVLPNGEVCGLPVGPGGRYCLRHACQALTAAGAPCKNAATEGSTRCPAHAMA